MTTREPYRPQRIGNLRERITLRYATYEDDGFGNRVETWHDVGPVAARIEPLKGDERVIAGGLANPFNVLVHIRHRSDVTPEWLVVHGGETVNITATRNLDERKRFLTLECEAGA